MCGWLCVSACSQPNVEVHRFDAWKKHVKLFSSLVLCVCMYVCLIVVLSAARCSISWTGNLWRTFFYSFFLSDHNIDWSAKITGLQQCCVSDFVLKAQPNCFFPRDKYFYLSFYRFVRTTVFKIKMN